MGCFNVYCGISKIAIGDNTDCVLLPLEKKNMHTKCMDIYCHSDYVPATLPIFGKYNDYGAIESIKKDFNTELIEKTYDCTIENFCNFLTRYNDYDGDELDFEVSDKLKSLKDLRYTWVNLEVWNYMINYNRVRNKKEFYYYYTPYKISNAIGIFVPDESSLRLQEIMDRKLIEEGKVPFKFDDFYEPFGVTKELRKEYGKLLKTNEIVEALEDLINIKINMEPFSSDWTPFIYLVTPQSGDYSNYKKIMKQFLKINNKILNNDY